MARFSFDIPAENRMSFRGNCAAVKLKTKYKNHAAKRARLGEPVACKRVYV